MNWSEWVSKCIYECALFIYSFAFVCAPSRPSKVSQIPKNVHFITSSEVHREILWITQPKTHHSHPKCEHEQHKNQLKMRQIEPLNCCWENIPVINFRVHWHIMESTHNTRPEWKRSKWEMYGNKFYDCHTNVWHGKCKIYSFLLLFHSFTLAYCTFLVSSRKSSRLEYIKEISHFNLSQPLEITNCDVGESQPNFVIFAWRTFIWQTQNRNIILTVFFLSFVCYVVCMNVPIPNNHNIKNKLTSGQIVGFSAAIQCEHLNQFVYTFSMGNIQKEINRSLDNWSVVCQILRPFFGTLKLECWTRILLKWPT